MSAGFTPGPWDSEWWCAVVRDFHNCLPDALKDEEPYAFKEGYGYPGFARIGADEPDARLIAAAPALYEALDALLNHPKISGCRPVNGDLHGGIFHACDEALKLARGEA